MTAKTIDLVASALFCARPTPVHPQFGEPYAERGGDPFDASEEEAARWDQWRLDVNEVEAKLAAAFPRFDRNAFLKACGYEP